MLKQISIIIGLFSFIKRILVMLTVFLFLWFSYVEWRFMHNRSWSDLLSLGPK